MTQRGVQFHDTVSNNKVKLKIREIARIDQNRAVIKINIKTQFELINLRGRHTIPRFHSFDPIELIFGP